MSKPIVAVVGRPNVGKSTLFNKLCGQRLAIVEDTPGITRDRIFANCEWSGHEFLLVDTGGIEPKATEGILAHMREQAQIAIDTADCIIMVVDVRNGLTAADEDVAHMLRRSHKPIILAVNKCDNVGETPMELYEFYNLGFDEVMPISSVHGHGTGDLLDAVCAHLDFSETVVEEDRIPVAIIGRPNVGKSSLTNRILGENRMIVANEAGTTRDAIGETLGNVTYKNESVDDVTLRYVDVDSHKKALETEQERLLALLEKAENVEDIITIENRLSDVRYELENYESQIRLLDNQIDYSTVYVDISEVSRVTDTGKQGFFEEVASRFSDSVYVVLMGLRGFAIGILGSLPILVVWGVILAVVVILLRKFVFKKSKKNKKNTDQTNENQQ